MSTNLQTHNTYNDNSKIQNTENFTLTSFNFERPFEEDNENVISKLLQRVKTSFSIPGGNSTTIYASTQVLPKNTTDITKNNNSSPTKPSVTSLLLPDKEKKGFVQGVTLAPPVISFEAALFDNAPVLLLESEPMTQDYSTKYGNLNDSTNLISEKANGVQHLTTTLFDQQYQVRYLNDAFDSRVVKPFQINSSSVIKKNSVSKAIRRIRGEGVNRVYWMADDTCKECYDCQIFCYKCSSNIISGARFNHNGSIRVCNYCHDEYSDFESDIRQNDISLMIPQRQLQLTMFSDNYNVISPNPQPEFSYSLAPPTPGLVNQRAPSPDTISINDGIKKMLVVGSSLFMTRSRSNTAVDDSNTFLSSSPAPFRHSLPEEDKVTPAANAEAVLDPEIAPFMSNDDDCNVNYDSLTNQSYLSAVSYLNNDSATPTPVASEYAGSDDESSDYNKLQAKNLQKPQRNEDTRAIYPKDKNYSSNHRRSISNARPTRPMKRGVYIKQINTNVMDFSQMEPRPSSPLNIRHNKSPSVPVKLEVNPISLQHMRQFLRQLLQESQIDLSGGWEDVIMKLVMKVADNLNPNVRNGDEIDIRHYVKIKKIPGGAPQDSEYVHGIVCTKNLAHKKMPRFLVSPRVLILTFALEYHRVENQLMSLDPVIAQEEEHLKNLVARISALAPHLVLVEKTVARKALQFLLEKNISVALNVKSSVIEAVARCSRADIISIEKLTSEPKLGKCGSFSVKTFVHQLIPGRRKTYLYFENCPRELGCTIVLRGGDINTLKKIKQITDLMVFVVYNLKLETALLLKQFARLNYDLNLVDRKNDDEDCKSKSLGISKQTQDIVRPYETRILSVSPFIKFPPPYLLTKMIQAERKLAELNQKHVSGWQTGSLKDSEKSHPSQSSSVTGLSGILRTPEQVCAEGEYNDAYDEYDYQAKAWKSHTFNNVVSPYAFQNITILYTKFCEETHKPCIRPEILVMEYYGESDRTIGQYIEDLITNSTSICQNCYKPMFLHYQSFCHGNSRITVHLMEYKNLGHHDVHEFENCILTWSYCKKCEKPTPVKKMSDDAWKYSFGKYLELSFYQTELESCNENCQHDVFKDQEKCFAFNNLAIKFEYEAIKLMEVHAPPKHLYYKPEVHIRLKNQDLDTIRNKITSYWDSVADRIKNFNYDFVELDKIECCKQELLEMSRRVVTERRYMLQKLQQTYVNSAPEDTLELNNVMYVLQEKVTVWDKYFDEIARQYFPRLTTKQLKRFFEVKQYVMPLGHGYPGSLLNDLPLINMDPDDTDRVDEELLGPTIFPKLSGSPTRGLLLNETKDIELYHEDEIENLENDIEKANSQVSMFPFMDPKISRRLSMKWMKESKTFQSPIKSNNASESIFTLIADQQEDSQAEVEFTQEPEVIPRLIPSTIKKQPRNLFSSYINFTMFDDTKETMQNKHDFQPIGPLAPTTPPISSSSLPSLSTQLSRIPLIDDKETKKVQLDRFAQKRSSLKKIQPLELKGAQNNNNHNKMGALHKPRHRRPTILTSKPTIEIFRNVSTATAEESDEDFEEVDDNYEKNLEDKYQIFSLNSTDAFDESLGNEEIFAARTHETSAESFVHHSALTFLGPEFNEPTSGDHQNLNNNSSGVVMPLMRSLTNLLTDRKAFKPLKYPLNPTEHVFPNSQIIVREDEPGSIIAFALNSQEYLEKLKNVRSINQTFITEDDKFGSKGSSWGILNVDEGANFDDDLISHMKCQLKDGSTQFFCKIFCAEQFDNLRRKCNCESTYIQSLARCVKWDSSGGKSGSAFLKTRDDRLVMKQMSRNEMDAFLKFAPKYFEHMSNALDNESTVLSKIFGFYRVGYKNEHTGKSMKIDLIVMENLFYERKVSKIFDLKGSIRNRHVQCTGKENEVLLDENLLELIVNENPIYLREHAKDLLRKSLDNDTTFLADHNVMDYSLLVGFDDDKQELVVGIVDFIRTFTWDKKLESWVKEAGFLGGGGKEPTIISPKQYENRFKEAMERYFLMVPDRWINYRTHQRFDINLIYK
ncbi:8398_t:CDS:10 [Entrophospora sp. SA101]|nr:8398_t:CDS:10 [Entrophospora sp. SA101]